jgi:hypothetical protein
MIGLLTKSPYFKSFGRADKMTSKLERRKLPARFPHTRKHHRRTEPFSFSYIKRRHSVLSLTRHRTASSRGSFPPGNAMGSLPLLAACCSLLLTVAAPARDSTTSVCASQIGGTHIFLSLLQLNVVCFVLTLCSRLRLHLHA